jgi:hypothetical protein
MIAAVAYGSAGFLSSLTVEQPLVMVTPLRYGTYLSCVQIADENAFEP